MAFGEYVPVSSQRDSERAMLALKRRELADNPHAELAELRQLYQACGLAPALARQVAEQLTAHDPGSRPRRGRTQHRPAAARQPQARRRQLRLLRRWGAAAPAGHCADALAARPAVTITVVLAAPIATGAASAALGRAPAPALIRNVLGGALAMVVTCGIGSLADPAGR